MAYVIAAVIVAAIIGGIVFLSKKTNERQKERMKMLSNAQLDFMKNKGVSEVAGEKNLLTAVAVLTNVKEGDAAKLPVDFIFYNVWTQNFEMGEDKISKDLMISNNIKVGDYITLVIKTKDGIIDKINEIKAFEE